MDLNKKISDQVAFISILVAGLIIAFFTISIGEKIIQDSEGSAVKKNLQIEKELDKI